jgi:hypothetical protein
MRKAAASRIWNSLALPRNRVSVTRYELDEESNGGRLIFSGANRLCPSADPSPRHPGGKSELPAPVTCPPFEEATKRFQAFLFQNGWPTEIVWVRNTDQREQLRASEAEGEYDFARRQGLGVCLDAIRIVQDSTIALVTYPNNADEAERLMYPADGGLKLSVVVTTR